MSEELVRSFLELFNAKLEFALAECNLTISKEVYLKLTDVTAELFVADFCVDIEPNQADEIGHARWRDSYNRTLRNRKRASEWIDAVVSSFLYVILQLPKHPQGMFKCEIEATEKMIGALTSTFIVDNNPDFFKTLKPKLLRKLDKKAEPTEILKGTPLAQLFPLTTTFGIPHKTFASHGIIVAPPNHGKTQLLGTFIKNFLENGIGCAVLDPHGDLFNVLRDRVPREQLVVLDPSTDPPPLNFLDFGEATQSETLQTFAYLMSSLSGGLTDKQGALVPYLLKLLRQIPDASLETLRVIVDEKVKRPDQSVFAPFVAALPAVDQGFFHSQFYHSEMDRTKQAIGWKLYGALASDAFREMFSAETNSFSADEAMNDGKVVLVKGSRRELGEDGMKIFLQFIVAQYFSAALRRERMPLNQRKLCVLCIDEAHHVFNSQTSNILTECRKYALGFLAATQVIQQIPDDVKAAIYGATAIKIAGPVSHTDASILSREMYTTPDFIRSMASVERSHADFAITVAPSKQALRITVPYGQLETLPDLSPPPPPRPRPAPASPVSEPKVSPAKPANAVSDIELVIDVSRRIETMLERHCAAVGKGLHEKLDSAEARLPSPLVHAGRYIATMRNKVLHVDAFALPDRDRFLLHARQFEEHFRTPATPDRIRNTPAREATPTKKVERPVTEDRESEY